MPAGTAITSNQTVYVYASTTGPTPCSAEDSFEVFIGIIQPADVSQCNGFTLPQLAIGNYFTAPNGTGQQIAAGTIIILIQLFTFMFQQLMKELIVPIIYILH